MRLRRLFRFRLRTLFLLMTAVSFVFGWFRPYEFGLSATDDYGLEYTALYHVRHGFFAAETAFGDQVRNYADGRSIHWTQWSGAPDPESHSSYRHQYVLKDGAIGSEEDWHFEGLIDLILRTVRPSSGWDEVPSEAIVDGQKRATTRLCPSCAPSS